jgi:hypothetical protein
MRRELPFLLVLTTLAACDEVAQYEFSAVGIAAADGQASARNEAVALRFSAPLDPTGLPADAIRVTSAEGRSVAVKLSTRGDVLSIEPALAGGWPAHQTLTVDVPFPALGRPVRSRDGAAPSGPFTASFRTGGHYAARGGDLKHNSRDLVNGVRVWSSSAAFRFDFDGPLDATTLADGVRLFDAEGSASAGGLVATVASSDRLVVAPFERGGFRGGATYRLEFTRALKSLDGRKLAAPVSWTFSTAKGRGGEHVTDFRPEDLVDPSLKPEVGPLKPARRPAIVVLGPDATQAGPVAFGGGAFRLQVLVPGAELGGEDALIERIRIPAATSGGAETLLESLEIRIGDPTDEAARELSEAFDDNWAGPPTTCALDDAPYEGAILVRAESDSYVEFRLAKPYVRRATFAEGMPRSLLLEISAGAPLATDGPLIALRGWENPAGGSGSVAAQGAYAVRGTSTTFVPALQLVATQYAPVLLKPWTADVPSPRYYFERGDGVVGLGRAFEDFTVEYRALTLSAGGGEPVDATPWSPRLSELHGYQTVQARILFHPRPVRPGEPRPEIERLALSFTADG